MRTLEIPDFCLVVLIGASGSGKSTFARRHFKPTEVISSDTCRGLVDDDETSQDATDDAFKLVHHLAATRLRRRRLTVVDATNVRQEDRGRLVRIAKEHHALAVAIVINPGEDLCHERNRGRPDRQFGPHVVRNQHRSLKRDIRRIDKEGFRTVVELRSPDEIEAITIARTPLWTDRRGEAGPFDIIGDVHGCLAELEALLDRLGYRVAWRQGEAGRTVEVTPPPGRRAIFVGDLVDRGPATPDVLRIVMGMVRAGAALCVPGNHDAKFLRWLNGRQVKLTHGLEASATQMEAEGPAFRAEVRGFLDGLVSHLWLEGGRLVVAHAGVREDMIGRASGAVREFCLYGDTTGEADEDGLPVRLDWAADYRGSTAVVYGHTPKATAEWVNNTICIDTGCCFGGSLTALRWPEREQVSVPAGAVYAVPRRPFLPSQAPTPISAQHAADDLLELEPLLRKLTVRTRLGPTVQVHPAQAAAALEVMSRFAVGPKWLVYLPPTMSPSETSRREGHLEHPDEAFEHFAAEGLAEVICEEKHMGSRAVLVICRDAGVATARFGVTSGATGAIVTRTGRAFFADPTTTEALLGRVRAAMDEARLWERLQTGWAVLDAEIMPWSAKADALIRNQYAPTGNAAGLGLAAASSLLAEAAAAGLDVSGLADRFDGRARRAEQFREAYRRYCWPVASLDDYRIAPFHLLATEGAVHMDKDHRWHMEELGLLTASSDPVLMATQHRIVQLDDAKSRAAATSWWEYRTAAGSEGMVVKPVGFTVRGGRGLVQPAVKCRGKEYLRLIYGPEYDAPDQIERLRARGLGHKRALAIREYVLGHEALSRFVAFAPLREVHECVFAVLALESEPVDPRL